MTKKDRDAWIVMSALVLTNILAAGPAAAQMSVFLTPLIRYFHWSHEEVSWIPFAITIAGGAVAPLVGWMVDRIGARIVMASGLVVLSVAYWLASMSNSIHTMVASFALFGAGVMLAGIVPILVVAINWFEGRRGFAGGVVFIAVGIGMSITPPILTWLIADYGWRIAMRWMSVPALFIVLPWVLAVVRTRPPMEEAATASQEIKLLPGLELWPALCTITFWLILLGDMLYTSSFQSVIIHTITYLIGLGYTPEHAAFIFSSQLFISAFGAITLGILADRYGVQRVMCTAMVIVAFGVLSLSSLRLTNFSIFSIIGYVLCWGGPAGAPFPLLPILLAETLGLRRLGTLSGLVRFFAAGAMAFGPVWSGHIFDVTGSYVPAFLLAASTMIVAMILVALARRQKGADSVPAAAGAAGRVAAVSRA